MIQHGGAGISGYSGDTGPGKEGIQSCQTSELYNHRSFLLPPLMKCFYKIDSLNTEFTGSSLAVGLKSWSVTAAAPL